MSLLDPRKMSIVERLEAFGIEFLKNGMPLGEIINKKDETLFGMPIVESPMEETGSIIVYPRDAEITMVPDPDNPEKTRIIFTYEANWDDFE